jgi:uncharacterized protein YqhQ
MNNKEEEKILPIGGQAVIEGVMMRGPKAYAVSVRKPDGSIETKVCPSIPITKRHYLLGLPFIRGVATLVDTLKIGMSALMFSANAAGTEKEKISKTEFAFSLALSLGLSVLLYIALPAGVFNYLKSAIENTLLLNLVEGLTRISIFILFILFISFLPDMRRIFEYHGAEHMLVHLFQEKKDINQLSVESAKQFQTLHPSCGTSFLLVVLTISIIVYSFLGRPDYLTRIALKLLLLPVISGIAYEIIRLARKPRPPIWAKIMVMPGMWLQYFTTRKPDDRQLEVALEAIRHAAAE